MAQTDKHLEQCFVQAPEGDNDDFICLACGSSRSLKPQSIRKHRQSPSHTKNFEKWLLRQSNHNQDHDQNTTTAINLDVDLDWTIDEIMQSDLGDESNADEDIVMSPVDLDDDILEQEERRRTLLDLWTRDHTSVFRSPALSINSHDSCLDETLSSNGSEEDDDNQSSGSKDPDQGACIDGDSSSWAPFSNLEELVGLMLLGSARTRISVLDYERERSIIGLLGVKLPGYKSLKNTRQKLKRKYNFNVSKTVSSLEKPCYGLQVEQILKQELGNPYVREFLDFMPKLPTSTSKINSLTQSKKWREGLDPKMRVQMIAQPHGHFYLFEPVQLRTKEIVVPIFFYRSGPAIYAKCVPTIQQINRNSPSASRIRMEFSSVSDFNSDKLMSIDVNFFWRGFDQIKIRDGVLLKNCCGKVMYKGSVGSFTEVPFTNPWRKKAGDRIIRHIPLVLYCDDLSGNVSKRWNKHIAFYFTLAGLPPKLANQEYNCHFLTTSNTAGALELATPVIDSINKLSTTGFVAFDYEIKAEVLVMPLILCHLGDLPMHAEVTNTMNPTSSLTPCRVCDLQVDSLADKKTGRWNFTPSTLHRHGRCKIPRV